MPPGPPHGGATSGILGRPPPAARELCPMPFLQLWGYLRCAFTYDKSRLWDSAFVEGDREGSGNDVGGAPGDALRNLPNEVCATNRTAFVPGSPAGRTPGAAPGGTAPRGVSGTPGPADDPPRSGAGPDRNRRRGRAGLRTDRGVAQVRAEESADPTAGRGAAEMDMRPRHRALRIAVARRVGNPSPPLVDPQPKPSPTRRRNRQRGFLIPGQSLANGFPAVGGGRAVGRRRWPDHAGGHQHGDRHCRLSHPSNDHALSPAAGVVAFAVNDVQPPGSVLVAGRSGRGPPAGTEPATSGWLEMVTKFRSQYPNHCCALCDTANWPQ